MGFFNNIVLVIIRLAKYLAINENFNVVNCLCASCRNWMTSSATAVSITGSVFNVGIFSVTVFSTFFNYLLSVVAVNGLFTVTNTFFVGRNKSSHIVMR